MATFALLVSQGTTWAGCGSEDVAAPPSPACEARSFRNALEAVSTADLSVHVETDGTQQSALVKHDVEEYLRRLWDTPDLQVLEGPPAFDRPYTIWVSSSDQAAAMAGGSPASGYVLRRIRHGDGTVVLVYAPDADNLAYGTYALLEALGVRFFHPMQELVPRLGGAYLPGAIDVQRVPAFEVRGVQVHLLHPLEYFPAFNEPGEENLQVARRYIDWLVKTGQNHLQWSILDTVDFEAWKPHAAQIIDYAHQRGVTVGAVVQVWGGASLQNAYDLITTQDGWQNELESQIDRLLALPWDVLEAGLGEFLSIDPHQVVGWLDHMTAYVSDRYPGTRVSITNHVGNFPEMWIDYDGQQVFYYHLPGFADPRLTNTVHTVFFFDLYRDWGGYGHPDFQLHRDFLFDQLPRRPMRYMPESAYWCTADVDVPLFLPEYVHARWVDIHNLVRDTRDRGLPPVEGHVMFSSGHEWGYWMTDYLAAKMMWDPDREMDSFFGDVAQAYGSCSTEIDAALRAYTHLQTEFLFDRRLIPYLSAEDIHDDLGYLVGIETHPRRIAFHELLAMTPAELDAFEGSVVAGLRELSEAVRPLEESVSGVCDRADDDLRPWCSELRDGIRVTRLRMDHSRMLNEAVIARARGMGDPLRLIGEAAGVRADAAGVVALREKDYRFDTDLLVGAYANPTRYPFGYLRQAHTQCLWERQEIQAAGVVENGDAPPIGSLPACQQ